MSGDNVDGAAIEARVRAGLKRFQQTTVDYVFKRMYQDPDPATRFLVADEVGLGKTLVARGLIARAIRHHQSIGTKRIDVIYICSNADIATQNIRRLNVTDEHEFAMATRITLLPLKLQRLKEHGLNFVSFTPGTSFNMASRSGHASERAVVFRLLEHALGETLDQRAGAYWALRSAQGDQAFRRTVGGTPRVGPGDAPGMDLGLANAFKGELATRPDLVARFRQLVDAFDEQDDDRDWHRRQDLILELRHTLARSCVDALEPDLIILDEFQRFRELLDEPDPNDPDDIRHLAHHLFKQQDTRTLLLSATPYKMFTLRDEEHDDHYADFLRTARFLMGDDETRSLSEDLHGFRQSLMTIGSTSDRALMTGKRRIETRLRRFMVRTERLAVGGDRNGMLTERSLPETRLSASDIRTYANVDRISRELRTGDVTDYWKSAPYLLNFMSDYQLKRELKKTVSHSPDASSIASLVDPSTLLPSAVIEAYEHLDPGNPRLRGLAADTIGRGVWQLLWLPPSLPYYRGRGSYVDAELQTMTKRLIFSSWNVVPDAISIILSYEAERRMMLSRDPDARNTADERAKLRGLLTIRTQDDRPLGMSTFGLLYPSVTLAEIADPLSIARDLGAATREVDADDIMNETIRRLQEALTPLTRHAPHDGMEDQRWYWAAPLLLDRRRWARALTTAWLAESDTVRAPDGTDSSHDDDAGSWAAHVGLARDVLKGGVRLGRVPTDLTESLALLALGAPGNCALRAIARVIRHPNGARQALADSSVRDAALRVAWGFRSLYNVPEVMSLLRDAIGQDEEAYWRRVAREGLHGNLQAVLDEFAHVLPEWLGMVDSSAHAIANQIGTTIHDAVAIRAVNYSLDDIQVEDGRLTMAPMSMRVRFAVRFGRDATDNQQVLQRSSAVRSAFNSPFWPFILSSTSVGQEGLDFHQYCHAVVHWNLPANPVDLEQREGRVHRYKGHAIRKNVAERHRAAAFGRSVTDPWTAMFAEAARGIRHHTLRDIEPFWVYQGSAHIERYVPLLPLSREVEQRAWLQRSLAAYRLVFGQPRQEDLVAYLRDRVDPMALADVVHRLRIDLTPK